MRQCFLESKSSKMEYEGPMRSPLPCIHSLTSFESVWHPSNSPSVGDLFFITNSIARLGDRNGSLSRTALFDGPTARFYCGRDLALISRPSRRTLIRRRNDDQTCCQVIPPHHHGTRKRFLRRQEIRCWIERADRSAAPTTPYRDGTCPTSGTCSLI